MNEYVKQHIFTTIRVLVFALGVFLVIHGQKTIGIYNLLEMFIGIICMLITIWDYNRRNR